jgi:hypothetical protein
LGNGPADAAAVTSTYTRTLIGPDFRPLDVRIGTQFVSNTGGGVFPQFLDDGSQTIPDTYLEAPVDVPIGAALTSVTFYFRDCGEFRMGGGSEKFPRAHYYAGYYVPATGAFHYDVPEGVSQWGDCSVRYRFTRTGTPLSTMAAGRRYVLGVHVTVASVGTNVPPLTDPLWMLYGARVQYTCDATCR